MRPRGRTHAPSTSVPGSGSSRRACLPSLSSRSSSPSTSSSSSPTNTTPLPATLPRLASLARQEITVSRARTVRKHRTLSRLVAMAALSRRKMGRRSRTRTRSVDTVSTRTCSSSVTLPRPSRRTSRTSRILRTRSAVGRPVRRPTCALRALQLKLTLPCDERPRLLRAGREEHNSLVLYQTPCSLTAAAVRCIPALTRSWPRGMIQYGGMDAPA